MPADSGPQPSNQPAAPSELERVVAELVHLVEELRADRDEDRALIDELLAELATAGARKPKAPPVYETWQEWVDGWLSVRISRSPSRHRWCHRYDEHREVADRLEALWHAWEAEWPDPLQRLPWYRDGLDHQLVVITAEDGPLRECSHSEGVHAQPRMIGQGRPGAATQASSLG